MVRDRQYKEWKKLGEELENFYNNSELLKPLLDLLFDQYKLLPQETLLRVVSSADAPTKTHCDQFHYVRGSKIISENKYDLPEDSEIDIISCSICLKNLGKTDIVKCDYCKQSYHGTCLK